MAKGLNDFKKCKTTIYPDDVLGKVITIKHVVFSTAQFDSGGTPKPEGIYEKEKKNKYHDLANVDFEYNGEDCVCHIPSRKVVEQLKAIGGDAEIKKEGGLICRIVKKNGVYELEGVVNEPVSS